MFDGMQQRGSTARNKTPQKKANMKCTLAATSLAKDFTKSTAFRVVGTTEDGSDMATKLGCPNIEDQSQIVRFASSFIAGTLTGISRALALMGVVLHSYAVFRQQKRRFART